MSKGIRFIQQSVDKQRQFFIGHYEDLNQLYQFHGYIVKNTFPNCKRVQSSLMKQGFISLLDDEFNLEYRIEVEN